MTLAAPLLTRCPCGQPRLTGAITVCIGCGWTSPAGRVPRGRVARFLYRLIVANGGVVTRTEMADWLWGDLPDGGPLTGPAVLRQTALEARIALRRGRLSARVNTNCAFGWRLEATP